MTFAEYQALDAVNCSTLKEMRKSPKHYRHRLDNGREDTRSMALGRATHTAVFEPRRFPMEYVIFEGKVRRGKDWDEHCAATHGKTTLSPDQYQTALDICDAVRAHPIAGPALTPPGEAEKVLAWTDERTGLACKGRLDWYRTGLLCDLKTTADLDADRFSATAYRLGYHMQAAFYRQGLAANGLDVPPFTIIAVESSAPHDVAVFELDDDALWAGELLVAECLDKVAAGRFSQR